VFHYPPRPLADNALRSPKARRTSRSRSRQNSKGNDSTSSDDSHSSSDEDEEEAPSQNLSNNNNSNNSYIAGSRRSSNFGIDDSNIPGESQRPGFISSSRAYLRKRGANSDAENDSGVGSDRQEDGSRESDGPNRVPWESILGLPVDVWEKLLSPSRSWHKRRFELGINDLAFVGWPVFIREDGNWRKQRRKKKKKQRAEWESGELGHNDATEDSQDDGNDAVAASTETLSPFSAFHPISQRPSVPNSRSSQMSSELLDADDMDMMTMFNVVFVLDPPLLEYSMRVREIYDNVIKKFSKALKWEQSRTNYVWRECQHILNIKEKAKETSTERPPSNSLRKLTRVGRVISEWSLRRHNQPVVPCQSDPYSVYQYISFEDCICHFEPRCVHISSDTAIDLDTVPPRTDRPSIPGTLAHYGRQHKSRG
jgi:hypothetical protein